MKKIRNAFGLVLLIALISLSAQYGIERARAAFWQWSMTPSANGNSDPSINFIEGMPPSVVNDSARAMMARLAEQAADTSGALVTTGGPTAFLVTTKQGLNTPTPSDGQVLGVTFNVNSAGSPTLAADGGTAEPIVSAPGTPANLTAGVPVIMLYQAASTSWIIRSGGGGGIMLGGVMAYTGTTAPPGYVFATGQCISTTTYALYWAMVGSPVPGSCAAGNFQVLDLRGNVPAGLDTMGGSSAAGRLTNAPTGCGTAMTTVGAICANGHEGSNITQSQLPLVSATFGGGTTLGGDFASSDISGQTAAFNEGTASVGYPLFGLNHHGNVTITGSITFPGGASGGVYMGSGQARPAVQPTIGLNYIIRVL
jgi:hypothetical protein